MKLTDIITQAQMLAGVGDFTGNAVDQNMMATCLGLFYQTLNNVNNDPKTTLWQETWDYQLDNDQPPREPVPLNDWISPFPPEEPDLDISDSKFPRHRLPFPVLNSYPFPRDCRRVTKLVAEGVEFRKVDFGEVVSARKTAVLQSVYAVNNRSIELVLPKPAKIIYAKEFPMFKPSDDVTLPDESLSYIITYTAYTIALAFNRGAADRCYSMMAQAYDTLVSNLAVNAGEPYLNPMTAVRRLTPWW